MAILLKLWGGRQLYAERDRWSSGTRLVEWQLCRRELLVWLGPWHFIWTPGRSAPAPRALTHDGRAGAR